MEIKSEQEFFMLIKEKIVLIDFYTDWCAPCWEQSNILIENYGLLSEKFPQVHLGKIDCDRLEGLANSYEIDFIPQLFLFKDSLPHRMDHGLVKIEKIIAFLDELLN